MGIWNNLKSLKKKKKKDFKPGKTELQQIFWWKLSQEKESCLGLSKWFLLYLKFSEFVFCFLMCNGFNRVNPFDSNNDIVVNLARLLLVFYSKCSTLWQTPLRSAVPTNTPALAATARTAHLGSAFPADPALAEVGVALWIYSCGLCRRYTLFASSNVFQHLVTRSKRCWWVVPLLSAWSLKSHSCCARGLWGAWKQLW